VTHPYLAIVLALLARELAPPPGKVMFPATNGAVTFDHPAHLERRETCRTCHGDERIEKVLLDKERGHALCRGCHEARGGPTRCSACHVGPFRPPK
jgi:predicted CXXCH cytochrome family protein